VLQQKHFPERRRGPFDYTKLSEAHILELEAGTGLFALALSPLVRKYTATDTPALPPLLNENILSASAIVTALDWTLPAQRQFRDAASDAPDLLLVVDCVYPPALVCPLLATLTALATPPWSWPSCAPKTSCASSCGGGACGALARTFWERAGGCGSPGAKREATSISAPRSVKEAVPRACVVLFVKVSVYDTFTRVCPANVRPRQRNLTRIIQHRIQPPNGAVTAGDYGEKQ